MARAKVWNVRIDLPVNHPCTSNPKAVIFPVTEILGSRLEIVNIADNIRKDIYPSPEPVGSPNCMDDGKKLLFNPGGSLYTLPVEGGTPEKLNTVNVKSIDNDLLISFNAKMPGISNSLEGLPGGSSTVYTLPMSGGEPRLITEDTPSRFHGWSPDGKEVVIAGKPNGSQVYNLLKIFRAETKESALTDNISGHVDRPEFSPDGKYIYYNANATGTMQTGRMKPGGSDQELLTLDQYHNWFAHV